jgi:hypothetical protein
MTFFKQAVWPTEFLMLFFLAYLAIFHFEEEYYLYFVSHMKPNLIAIEGTR